MELSDPRRSSNGWSRARSGWARLQEPGVRYLSPSLLALWDPLQDFRYKDLRHEDFSRIGQQAELYKKITKAFHAGGARILLGTDTPNPFVVPGFSIHEELRNLVDAGLTPYQALKAGTTDAAEFLNQLGEFGTVTVGRCANLLLLEADPLKNVRNVERRVGVVVRGHWLAEPDVRVQLNTLASSFREGKARKPNRQMNALVPDRASAVGDL